MTIRFIGVITISIHALVKRATQRSINPFWVLIYFNPRPREEGDEIAKRLELDSLEFQSTPS